MIDQPLHIVQVSIFRCHKSAPYYYHNCINQEFSRCQSYADVWPNYCQVHVSCLTQLILFCSLFLWFFSSINFSSIFYILAHDISHPSRTIECNINLFSDLNLFRIDTKVFIKTNNVCFLSHSIKCLKGDKVLFSLNFLFIFINADDVGRIIISEDHSTIWFSKGKHEM